MAERPYRRYTRTKTWAALYSQHINAGYAWVPFSATNNSIDVIFCTSPEETQKLIRELEQHADECKAYYSAKQTPDKAPAVLAEHIKTKKLRSAVVLAKSSDYYHYHLDEYSGFRLVICGLHDSYLHLPVWEMRTNTRYKARETVIPISSPDFDHIRRTQFGHNILIGALINGDETALSFKKNLPSRTQSRLTREVQEIRETRYCGRPLAFLTDAERQEIGSKISEGLRRYHERKRLRAI